MCWWLGRIGVERRASLKSQAFVVDSYGSQLIDSNISQLILKWCSLDSNDKDSDFLSIHQLPFSVHSKISYRLLSDNGVRETRNAVLAYELRVEDFRLPGMGGVVVVVVDIVDDSCRLTYFPRNIGGYLKLTLDTCTIWSSCWHRLAWSVPNWIN